MKSRFLILAFLLLGPLFVSNTYAQVEEGSFVISASYDRMSFVDYTTKQLYSADLQYFVHDNWSLNYTIGFGENYAHMPISVPLVFIVLPASWYWGQELLYVLMLPEGISYHVPIGDSWRISPYANVLGFDYRNMEGREYWLATSSAGVRVQALVGNSVVIAPFAEIKSYFGELNGGLRTGVSIGIHIPD